MTQTIEPGNPEAPTQPEDTGAGTRSAATTPGTLPAALKRRVPKYADLAPLGAAARFANVNHAAGCLAAIARTRRELADDPSRRSDAVMRIIHGRAAA